MTLNFITGVVMLFYGGLIGALFKMKKYNAIIIMTCVMLVMSFYIGAMFWSMRRHDEGNGMTITFYGPIFVGNCAAGEQGMLTVDLFV